MIPLIDGDILRYELGFAAEVGWNANKEGEEKSIPPFSYVEELLLGRIQEICKQVEATEKPRIFLSGRANFRNQIAKKKPYKGNRQHSVKPFHYNNLTAYLIGVLEAEVVEGIEADDMICIEATNNNKNAIICTRDKDLRQCKGWHYGWELGNQPAFGPFLVRDYGYLQYDAEKFKLVGTGDKFFLAQCIMGDPTDNIPGLPKYGPKKAFEILEDTNTYEEGEQAVVEAYKAVYGDDWYEELMEQAHLVYMIRELDDEGHPIMFKLKGDYGISNY